MLVQLPIPLKKVLLLLMTVWSLGAMAQEKTISIVKDNQSPFLNQIEVRLKKELNDLMTSRYSLRYLTFENGEDQGLLAAYYDSLYAVQGADLIIGLGMISSQLMAQRSSHSIPSIATMVFDQQTRAASIANNYLFSRPYGSLVDMVRYFAEAFEIQSIGVTGYSKAPENNQSIGEVTVTTLATNSAQLPDGIEGILLIPQAFANEAEVTAMIELANQRNIPTFSATAAFLNLGCTASIQDEDIIMPLLKETALNSLYFFENKSDEEIADYQAKEGFNLVLNMASVKRIQKLPNWKFFEEAVLVNLTQNLAAETLTLEAAIAMGMEQKLSLQKSQLRIASAEQDQRQAVGNMMPGLSVGAQSLWLSDNVVAASLGQKGALTVSGNASLRQVLFAEPVLANMVLKKLSLESTKEQTQQEFLDDLVSITYSYIAVLLAQANLSLQNENLNVTKSNLAVAKTMEAQGMVTGSDVNRWLSEVNLNKVQLSGAEAKYMQAMYALNEVLNQPIVTKYNFPDSIDREAVFKFPTAIIDAPLRNQLGVEKLADFYVQEMNSGAPALKILDYSKEINDRKMRTAQRRFYLPELVGFASANDLLSLQGLQPNPQLPVPPPPQDLTWSAGVSLSIPLLDHRSRQTNLQQAKIARQVLAISRQEVENTLESKVRAQVQQLRASYLSVNYASRAETAANANYLQAQNAYQQGFITIVAVLEAQLAKFNANLLSVQTRYQLALDYIMLERLTGNIQLLNSSEEQNNYANRLKQFLWEQ